MCALRHHCRLFTFILLFFSTASPITITITTLAPQPTSGGTVKYEEMKNGSPTVAEQKKIGGPGSTPPSCRSKCGWCNPCQPVHVPVQPGLVIRLEYYPEAWRCKCGNKLFLP